MFTDTIPDIAITIPRHSLVSNVLDVLRAHIQRGEWTYWLPSERKLCELLQISRGTLRVVISQLKKEGLIVSQPGRGNRVVTVTATKKRTKRTYAIGLILPEPIQNMRQSTALWIDALRARLFGTGFHLALYEGQQWYRSNSANALEKLTSSVHYDCWVLVYGSQFMQNWFSRKKLRCIVAGSCYPGVDLPSIDLDHYGVGRHLAGTLAAHGHHRIALMHSRRKTPGDLAMKAGFLSTFAARPPGENTLYVVEHEDDVGQFVACLLRFLKKPQRPTAIIIANSYFCSTVLTVLLRDGYHVPADISIVCRDDDLILQYLVPSPAHYTISVDQFASKLARSIHQLCEEGMLRKPHTFIVPTFHQGETIARIRG